MSKIEQILRIILSMTFAEFREFVNRFELNAYGVKSLLSDLDNLPKLRDEDEDSSRYNVFLLNNGTNKIATIRLIRMFKHDSQNVTFSANLREVKDFVDDPKNVKIMLASFTSKAMMEAIVREAARTHATVDVVKAN